MEVACLQLKRSGGIAYEECSELTTPKRTPITQQPRIGAFQFGRPPIPYWLILCRPYRLALTSAPYV